MTISLISYSGCNAASPAVPYCTGSRVSVCSAVLSNRGWMATHEFTAGDWTES